MSRLSEKKNFAPNSFTNFKIRSKYFTLTQRIDYARLNCFYDRERAKQSLIELNKIIGFDWEYFHEDSETEQDENEDEKDIDDQEDFRESNNTQSNGSNEKRSKTIDSKTISRIKSLKNLRKNKIKIASNCRRNRYRKQLKNLRQKQLESLKQIRTDQLLLQILWEVKLNLADNRNQLRRLARYLERNQ